jgi:hypothetical protein
MRTSVSTPFSCRRDVVTLTLSRSLDREDPFTLTALKPPTAPAPPVIVTDDWNAEIDAMVCTPLVLQAVCMEPPLIIRTNEDATRTCSWEEGSCLSVQVRDEWKCVPRPVATWKEEWPVLQGTVKPFWVRVIVIVIRPSHAISPHMRSTQDGYTQPHVEGVSSESVVASFAPVQSVRTDSLEEADVERVIGVLMNEMIAEVAHMVRGEGDLSVPRLLSPPAVVRSNVMPG